MKRLKAFTILELMVVMLITSVVVLIAYSALSVVQQQFAGYRASSGNVAELANFNTSFQLDWNRALLIHRAGDDLQLHLAGNRTIQYRFLADGIVRHEGGYSDTLQVAVAQLKTSALRLGNARPEAVQTVSFEITDIGGKQQCVFRKEYGSRLLMDAEKANENRDLD